MFWKLRWLYKRSLENIQPWVASKVPRWLAYWCAIRVMTKDGGSTDRPCSGALKCPATPEEIRCLLKNLAPLDRRPKG